MNVFPHIQLHDALSREDGQSLVETALALPLLLTLLCGIVDFGWIYSNQYQTEYAAQAAVRYAVINVSNASDSQLAAGAEARAMENISTGGDNVTIQLDRDTNSITVTVSRPVKCLTFVAGTVFGENYTSTSTSVGSY